MRFESLPAENRREHPESSRECDCDRVGVEDQEKSGDRPGFDRPDVVQAERALC
jgi:hypothetical protein